MASSEDLLVKHLFQVRIKRLQTRCYCSVLVVDFEQVLILSRATLKKKNQIKTGKKQVRQVRNDSFQIIQGLCKVVIFSKITIGNSVGVKRFLSLNISFVSLLQTIRF